MKIGLIAMLFGIIIVVSTPSQAEIKTAETVIFDFYKEYLNYNYKSNKPRPELTFSKEFKKAIQDNEEACKLYSTGICGWDAEGDTYTASQDSDENLNFDNSNFSYQHISKNKIQVKLNVFPSDPDPYYDSVITFNMIIEDGKYVVDDILYGKEMLSTRSRIDSEIESIQKNPDIDSVFCLQQKTADKNTPNVCQQ
jgi:hypothetical protein